MPPIRVPCPHQPSRWPGLALGGALALIALQVGPGCKGAVGDDPGNPGTAGGTSAGAAGNGAGQAGATGAAGTNSSGGAGSAAGPLDIGFGPTARLNQRQYNNTVRDLLGTSLTPGDTFPPDEQTLGFDTIAGVLRVQPEHVEKYIAAAHTLVDEFLARPATDSYKVKYLTCDYKTAGATCHKAILKAFATKAWRRPVVDAELTPYLTLAAAQPTQEEGLNAALVGVLSSTKFVYRIESDPDPTNTTPHRLTAHELATRLSYFLWSTMPDDALSAAADSGALTTDAGLDAQISRMLGMTARARTLVETFGAQWLEVNRMQAVTPDGTMFAAFTPAIRQAMMDETKEFVWDFLSNDRPVSQMLTADFTYVNAALATLYGLPAPAGTAVQKVMTTGTKRTGILTQGSYLAGNSNPTRTSPVKRGLYVLDRLLCAAPPPPPATVNLNIDQGSGLENLPLRARLAEHQKQGASCAACHITMDAIGLGVENYDAIGRYRTADEYGAIDPAGVLPGVGGAKTPFAGVTELAQALSTDPRITPCLVQKLLTFGVGREFGTKETPVRDAVAANVGAGTLRAAIAAVIKSDVFRSRRAATLAEVMAK
jgi:hypothetical protein